MGDSVIAQLTLEYFTYNGGHDFRGRIRGITAMRGIEGLALQSQFNHHPIRNDSEKRLAFAITSVSITTT